MTKANAILYTIYHAPLNAIFTLSLCSYTPTLPSPSWVVGPAYSLCRISGDHSGRLGTIISRVQ